MTSIWDIPPYSVLDVLIEAGALLVEEKVEADSGHGPFCPFCAIAQARDILDVRHGTQVTLLEAVTYLNVELPCDAPLTRARTILLDVGATPTPHHDKTACLGLMDSAIAKAREESHEHIVVPH